MTNDQSGLSGIDNLTPFEYALAGVAPTTNQESPSLLVIESMRALADEVEDAPITQARLQDLMRTGGSAARRTDRRIRKRRRAAAASGGFVDITPVELTGEHLAAPHAEATGSDGPGSDGPGSEVIVNPVAFVEADPTSEQPAIAPQEEFAAPADVVDPADDRDLGDVDGTEVEAETDDAFPETSEDLDRSVDDFESSPGVEVEALVDTEQSSVPSVLPPDFDDQDFDREFDAIQQAMLNPDLDEPLPVEDPDDLAAVLRDLPPPSLDDADLFVDGNDGDESHDDHDSDADEVDSLFTRTSDEEIRDASGRFAGVSLFEPEPPLTSEDSDPGPAVFVPAGAGDDQTSVLSTDSDDRQPLAVAALTGAVPAPAPTRRFGSAFWALAGTAAAAAVLALGGLLWANSLEDPEQTETANAAATDEVETSDQSASESNEGGETSAAATLEEPSDASSEDRDPLTVDGEDSPATTVDPAAPTVTTSEDGDRTDTTLAPETTEAPGTTESPTTTEAETTTTVATTEQTTTTEATTTEAPTTLPPTTKPPTTTVPPTTVPPTTLPPELPPSFIGDRVTIGSFDGPGAVGVRVRLLRDADSNGTGDQLVGTDTTNEGGYYGFDDYDAGCYVVQFSELPSGTTMTQGQGQQRVCIHEGGDNGRIDAVVVLTPPAACVVEVDDGRYWRGVEVHEGDFLLSDSYTFYGRNGEVVVKTKDLGPPDDTDEEPYGDWEWFGPTNGFNHRSVYSVAAEQYGVESAPVTCERQ